MERRPLVVIGGATAVGKTSLSVELAKRTGGEIISADSMQVYKGMDIGTAKITKEEMNGVCHYMIDVVQPDEEFNVFEFKKRADRYIEQIYANGHIPFLVGGTGFYIQAVLYDIDFSKEETDSSYRKYLETLDETSLYKMLKETDPDSAAMIHPNNKKRMIRALEFYHNTGQTISGHNAKQRQNISPYNYVYFVLNRDRAEIYKRIEQRVDSMIEAGLEDEVRGLLESCVPESALSMQAIGYKEMISYLKGDMSINEAADLIKLNSRHFAKRQITWFKREKEAIWIDHEDYGGEKEMLDAMINIIKEKHIV